MVVGAVRMVVVGADDVGAGAPDPLVQAVRGNMTMATAAQHPRTGREVTASRLRIRQQPRG